MKIALFVTKIENAPGFENVVSAHVQLPLHTIKLLSDKGHKVDLITTEFGKNRSLPKILPEGVTVHQVIDGRCRGNGFVMDVGFKKGIHPVKFINQLRQLQKIIKTEKYDILHFFGSNRMAYLIGLLGLTGLKTPVVLTMNSGQLPERFWFVTKHLWKKVALVITSTEFFRNKCKAQGIFAKTLKHGIIRNIKDEIDEASSGLPHRVLFWRDPSRENGADICLQVFRQLAPKFPNIRFDLAVRPHWEPVTGIKELCEAYPNVNVYHFPYKQEISLSQLVAESICILLPFRELSTHPQFSIMESMMSGVAVVTTALDSNFELINSGQNGFLVPVGDVKATIEKVEELLIDRNKAKDLGKKAVEDIRAKWNWDQYVLELVDMYGKLIR